MDGIPRFNLQEATEIEKLFIENKIAFNMQPCLVGVDSFRGYTEYDFLVPYDYFRKAIDLLKEFYGLTLDKEEKFKGNCPCCGEYLENVSTCTNCELELNYNPDEALKDHPFYIFLKKNDLL